MPSISATLIFTANSLGYTPLQVALRTIPTIINPEYLVWVLMNRPDIRTTLNAYGGDGRTALAVASEQGYPDWYLAMMVRNGADPNKLYEDHGKEIKLGESIRSRIIMSTLYTKNWNDVQLFTKSRQLDYGRVVEMDGASAITPLMKLFRDGQVYDEEDYEFVENLLSINSIRFSLESCWGAAAEAKKKGLNAIAELIEANS